MVGYNSLEYQLQYLSSKKQNSHKHMKTQDFNNHSRLVAGWHGITFFALLALLIGSFVNLAHAAPENLYSASLICLVAVILGFFFAYTRIFALKAQDRAIKAEESLRYYIMTGKALPAELKISQIIALRFASDAEYLALLDRAIKENLSNKEIKLAIQNWKADYYRV